MGFDPGDDIGYMDGFYGYKNIGPLLLHLVMMEFENAVGMRNKRIEGAKAEWKSKKRTAVGVNQLKPVQIVFCECYGGIKSGGDHGWRLTNSRTFISIVLREPRYSH